MASGLVLWCMIDWLFGVGSISAVEFKRICFGFGVWEWTLILDSPSDLDLMGFYWGHCKTSESFFFWLEYYRGKIA
jgi:hypothetical protein